MPPILPVVLAHDERGWRSARHFHELFARDPGTQAVLEHVRFFAAYFASLEPVSSGLQDSDRVIGYLGEAAGERSVDVEVLVGKIIAHAPTAHKVVMNSVDRLREEGRQQGREEGRQQGREEGQRDMLLELLREKFGGVEEADVARVAQADEAALERCLKRILTADSIDAVFGD